jgi:sugar phosphate permease
MANSILNANNKKYLTKAFLVLLVCGIFLFYKYIAQLFPSVISADLLNANKFTGVEIAIMASSYYYSYSFVQILAGYIIDRYDVRLPCFLAILLVSLAMIGFSYTDSFYAMCISRATMGIGAAFATVLYMKCAAVWASPKAFGIISSLLATVTMFGAAFGSAPIAWFFERVGWNTGINVLGVIGVALAFLALIFVSNKGSKAGIVNFKLSFADVKKIIINKSNWLLFIYAGITFSPALIIGGLWGNPFLIEKFHITNTSASMLLFTMFIGIGIGAPIWAIISANLNKRKILMHLANLISLLSFIGIIYLDLSYNLTMLLFFTLGFSIGCFMICFQLCREINSVYVMGIAVAFVNMGDGIISSILEPLIGYILDALKTGNEFSLSSYKIALTTLPLCFILSSIVLIYLKAADGNTANRSD